ncbi:hypothetical protein BDY19DRAFT_910493 [Irpex rosettiformis]|uniref:Uncharacterized protein n=1 Tax=Irpex rosettiformis TaxID=378272 RepID=A0ACB8TNF4_9APHY|nr:hypothetical protein BDY19DRAFT_910493 [Irpex rosettiformis]
MYSTVLTLETVRMLLIAGALDVDTRPGGMSTCAVIAVSGSEGSVLVDGSALLCQLPPTYLLGSPMPTSPPSWGSLYEPPTSNGRRPSHTIRLSKITDISFEASEIRLQHFCTYRDCSRYSILQLQRKDRIRVAGQLSLHSVAFIELAARSLIKTPVPRFQAPALSKDSGALHVLLVGRHWLLPIRVAGSNTSRFR